MALYLDVGLDDVLRIGDDFVTVERKSGSRARLRIISAREVELMRKAKVAEPAAVKPAEPERAG